MLDMTWKVPLQIERDSCMHSINLFRTSNLCLGYVDVGVCDTV